MLNHADNPEAPGSVLTVNKKWILYKRNPITNIKY